MDRPGPFDDALRATQESAPAFMWMRFFSEASNQPFGHVFPRVRIFTLAILAFLLCSCAGFHLKRGDDTENIPRIPGEGDVGDRGGAH